MPIKEIVIPFALAALTAGVLIKNPNYVKMKKDFNEKPMIQFWII